MSSDLVNETTPLVQPPEVISNSSSLPKTPELVVKSITSSQPTRPGFRHYLSLVTVEPMLFLYMLAYGEEMIFKTNMLVDKTCFIQLQYSADVCHNLDSGEYEREQNAVQRLTSNYNLYCQLIEMVPGVFLMVLLGTWSDTRSRRLPLLIPMLGATLKALGLFCNAYWWPLQPFYITLSYIPSGLTGSTMASVMAAFAYVSENSSQRGRTARLTFVSVISFAAVPLGNTVGDFLFGYGKYIAVFGGDFILCLLSFIYVFVRFKDQKPKSSARLLDDGAGNQMMSFVRQMKRSLNVLLQRREARTRSRILAHVCCISLFMASVGAFGNFGFLYTRKKFQWTFSDYTVWSFINSFTIIVVSNVMLPVLSLRYRMEDSLLGFIGAVFYSFFGVLMGTAPTQWLMYLSLIPSSGIGMISASSRGALSKLVAPDELGAVFSVVGMGETLLPLLVSPIYTLVYNNTLETLPGTVFLMSSSIALIICCIYTWLATAFLPPLESKKELG